jgi:cell division transport system permease protein
MPRFDYYFRETASGLRRNGTVAFSAWLTSFIALFLMGLALLVAREFHVAIEALTGNVEVAVYLSDPVNPDNLARLQHTLEELPAVSGVVYWDKTLTCENYHKIFATNAAFNENVNCEQVIPTSLRVRLADTSQFGQITAVLGCTRDQATGKMTCAQPGVQDVADFSSLLNKLSTLTSVISISILAVSILMLLSAIALVANTLRIGMFARRKEIAIMRLVGATNWRIRVPFLIEALTETLLGAVAAIMALFLVKVFAIDRLRSHFSIFPLVKNADVLAVAPWIIVAAAFVAIVAGTFGMRRFLDV